jgi:hypothetical protein
VTFEPVTLTLAGGTTRTAAAIVTNTTSQDIELFISDGCDAIATASTEIDGDDGNRVDTTGDQCGEGSMCGHQTVDVALAPGGTIRVPFTIDARKLTYDKDCKERRVGKVAAGHYKLHVRALSGLIERDVPVTVR